MQWDVIVVGGGIAGLSIANHIARTRKQRILVVEQYKAWGGRTATVRSAATDTVPELQYEAGAGRIFRTHTRVSNLVKQFGLHTYPITSDSLFEQSPNPFVTLMASLKPLLESLSKHDLATHTLYELVPDSMRHVFAAYPYWAEIQLMRADLSVATFSSDEPMGSHKNTDFYGIVEGIDSLADSIYTLAEAAGVVLQNRHRVDEIRRVKGETTMFEVKGMKEKTVPFRYTSSRVIIATPFSEFGKFSVLKDTPMLKQLAMSPLLRIYAVYPPSKSTGKLWFSDVKKTVTTNPLRYVIPINPKTGLIMISYTDGKDTDYWRAKEGDELDHAIESNVRSLFPSLDIPKPVYLKKHDWVAGCTYWLPGDYDVAAASRDAHNPSPNVFVCGESVSQNQAWIEGALESVETLKTLL